LRQGVCDDETFYGEGLESCHGGGGEETWREPKGGFGNELGWVGLEEGWGMGRVGEREREREERDEP